jgi:predicted RNA-binding protein YlqC (UPF0109 family)
LIAQLLDFPEELSITEDRHRGGTRYEVLVDHQDLGKVIGRQGRTARALRTLLDVRGRQDGRRYGLEIRGTS